MLAARRLAGFQCGDQPLGQRVFWVCSEGGGDGGQHRVMRQDIAQGEHPRPLHRAKTGFDPRAMEEGGAAAAVHHADLPPAMIGSGGD